MEEKKYEMVEHPAHYNLYSMETIEMDAMVYGNLITAIFCEISALNYRLRMGLKPDNSVEQELEKEKWYLNKRDEYAGCFDIKKVVEYISNLDANTISKLLKDSKIAKD